MPGDPFEKYVSFIIQHQSILFFCSHPNCNKWSLQNVPQHNSCMSCQYMWKNCYDLIMGNGINMKFISMEFESVVKKSLVKWYCINYFSAWCDIYTKPCDKSLKNVLLYFRVPTALAKSLKFRSVSRSWKNHWISWKVLEICKNEKKNWKIIELWISCSWKNHWILK